MSKLTIGMCVYDDYEGLYFTIQSLRLHHREVMNDIEFVIVNNNPSSSQGKAVKEFVDKMTGPVQYLEFTAYTSTALRNKIFDLATTPYVLVLDCHVLLQPHSLSRLIDFFEENKDEGNLLHGPLIHDSFEQVETHFNREWKSGMHGTWEFDPHYIDENSPPFEINACGLGVFACRRSSWLGFNPNFRGFGGEENYIHDKFRKAGKKVLCLPFLGWVHRFVRVKGVPYPNSWEDRYRNYIIGHIELGKPILEVDTHFAQFISEQKRNEIKREALGFEPVSLAPTTFTATTTVKVKQGCGCKKG